MELTSRVVSYPIEHFTFLQVLMLCDFALAREVGIPRYSSRSRQPLHVAGPNASLGHTSPQKDPPTTFGGNFLRSGELKHVIQGI